MKLIRSLSLAALMAVAAMALIGASSAMAKENTALCLKHEEPCKAENLVKLVHFTAASEIKLLSTAFGVKITILCLESLLLGHVENEKVLATAPEPLKIEILELLFLKCGTNGAHDNCTITALKQGLIDILKTELNLGTAEILNVKILKACDLGILGKLHCDYGVEGATAIGGFTIHGASATNGHGMFKTPAAGLLLPILESLIGVCPKESIGHVLYEPLVDLFIVG